MVIQWDYLDENSMSYGEVMEALEDPKVQEIHTPCLNFFNTCNINALVRDRNGNELSVKSLLDNTSNATVKHIRPEHNLSRMLIAGAFKW